MAEDIEVGVRLVPDKSELEDIEDQQVQVSQQGAATQGGGAGGNAAAGGFAGAETGELLGKGGIIAGLLAGILSQLKPVTQFVKLIFRVLSLALLPAIQLLVVALRPLLTNLAQTSQALESPDQTVNAAQKQFERDTGISPQQQNRFASTAFNIGVESAGRATGLGASIDAIESVINQEPSSADLTDEGKKNQQANLVKDVLELIP